MVGDDRRQIAKDSVWITETVIKVAETAPVFCPPRFLDRVETRLTQGYVLSPDGTQIVRLSERRESAPVCAQCYVDRRGPSREFFRLVIVFLDSKNVEAEISIPEVLVSGIKHRFSRQQSALTARVRKLPAVSKAGAA